MSKERTFPDIAILVGTPKLRELLLAGANIHERDSNGRTALFRTCRLGQLEKLHMLIAAGSDPNAVDNNGEAPLQSAARYGHLECVDALIKDGADINYCPPPSLTEYSESALCSAVRKSPEAARLLLAHGADPNAATDAGLYPLLAAIAWSHSDLVPLLLEHSASAAVCNRNGETALHLAVRYGDAKSVKALLNAGADKNARDARGETPIYTGVDSEYDALPGMVEILKADPDLTIPDSVFGMTPLERAIFVEKPKIAEVLRAAGSPPPRERFLRNEQEEVEVVIELTEADLMEMEERGPDWLDLIEPFEEMDLIPTQEERAWALEADREIPSLVGACGHGSSKPHWELLRHAKQPMPLKRMAYYARGFLNAPPGRELEDGPKVLGETYETAVERFVTLGLLRRVEGPPSIHIAFSQAELCALAKKHQLKSSGSKGELAERLFSALGETTFAERMRAQGGYFVLTPAGIEEAGKFQINRERLEMEKRQEVLNALIQHDYLSAAKAVRVLVLMKACGAHRVPKTEAKRIAIARAIREREMPKNLMFDVGSEIQYMSIAAAHELLGQLGDEWSSWDSSLKPLETVSGEPIELHEFCAALQDSTA
jgi:ankyrin repeat protein